MGSGHWVSDKHSTQRLLARSQIGLPPLGLHPARWCRRRCVPRRWARSQQSPPRFPQTRHRARESARAGDSTRAERSSSPCILASSGGLGAAAARRQNDQVAAIRPTRGRISFLDI